MSWWQGISREKREVKDLKHIYAARETETLLTFGYWGMSDARSRKQSRKAIW